MLYVWDLTVIGERLLAHVLRYAQEQARPYTKD